MGKPQTTVYINHAHKYGPWFSAHIRLQDARKRGCKQDIGKYSKVCQEWSKKHSDTIHASLKQVVS